MVYCHEIDPLNVMFMFPFDEHGYLVTGQHHDYLFSLIFGAVYYCYIIK